MIFLIPSNFEAKSLLDAVDVTTSHKTEDRAEWHCGKWHNVDVTLGIIGMGVPHAPKRAKSILQQSPAKQPVILCGFAGALAPGWRQGQIAIHRDHAKQLPDALIRELPRHTLATIYTTPNIVATPEEKQALYQTTGCALVDMETEPVADLCTQLNRKLVTIRIVSDTAEETLPSDLLSRSYDQEAGRYTPGKLAGHLTRHPFKVPKLTRFIAPLPAVRRQLTAFLQALLVGSQAHPW